MRWTPFNEPLVKLHEIAHPSGRHLTVYEIPGPSADAPAILLLHGLGASFLLNWKPVLALLAREYRVLGIDHRGHSRGLDSSSCRFDDCADDIAIALEAMGINALTVAGYSMGGPIALHLWRRHPGKVSGLLLIATATSLRHLRTKTYYLAIPVLVLVSMYYALRRRAYVNRWVRTLQGMFPGQFTDDELSSELSGHRPMTLLRAVLSTAGFAVDWGSEVDVPLVALVTAKDDIVPPELQRRTARDAVLGKAIDMEGGHQAIFSQPDEFKGKFVEACKELALMTRTAELKRDGT